MSERRRRAFLVALVAAVAGSCTSRVLQPALPGAEPARPGAARPLPTIPEASAAAAQVPNGYRVEAAVTGLTYPTSVEFDDRGRMFVAEAGAVYGDRAAPARILRIARKRRVIVADQLEAPVKSLLWHDGKLYFSQRGKISVVEGGKVRDLVTGLPAEGDHALTQLCAGPDGRLYFGVGSATNAGVVGVDNFLLQWLALNPSIHDVPAKDITISEETFETLNPMTLASRQPSETARTAPFQPFGKEPPPGGRVRGSLRANGTLMSVKPDGSDLRVFAWGLRAPEGLAFSPDGRLFVAENGYDERGSRPIANAPDVLFVAKAGGWYGFPDFAAGVPINDPRFRVKGGPEIHFVLKEHPKVEKPYLTMRPHTGVRKIAFAPRGSFGFEGQLFLAAFGDLPPFTHRGSAHTGHEVYRIDPQSGATTVFFRAKAEALGPKGLEYVATAGPRRPVDVRFSPRGTSLYVVDQGAMAALDPQAPLPRPFEGTGVVWRIWKEEPAAKPTPTPTPSTPEPSTPEPSTPEPSTPEPSPPEP